MTLRPLLLAGIAIVALAVGGTLIFAPWNGPSNAQVAHSSSASPPPISQAIPPASAPASEPATLPVTVPRQVPPGDGQVKLSFAPVVKAVAPSVVNVYATRIEQQTTSPFANDPFFSRFFGNGQYSSRPRESQALGSGVIVDASGVILTNRHVIEGATDVRISLSEGREFPVDVVIQDVSTAEQKSASVAA